jgi:hypothetical protein
LKLGYKIANIRYRGNYATYSDSFKRLGLDISKAGTDSRHWSYVYSALKIFYGLYGHVNVPCTFEVPTSNIWPENLHGLKLGVRVRNIRYRGDFVKDAPENRILLNELKFVWKKNKKKAQAQSDLSDTYDIFTNFSL